MDRKKIDPVMAAVSELGNATRAGDVPRIDAARRRLAVAKVQREIDAALSGSHPITTEQRQQLAASLLGGE